MFPQFFLQWWAATVQAMTGWVFTWSSVREARVVPDHDMSQESSGNQCSDREKRDISNVSDKGNVDAPLHPGVQKLVTLLQPNSGEASDIEIHTPNSRSYLSLSRPFNKRLSSSATPGLILIPTTIEQISTIVKTGHQCGLGIIARSGGHSYAGFSSGAKAQSAVDAQGGAGSDTVIVDIGAFNSIDFHDDIGEMVTIGGGCQLGRIAGELFKRGRALPHGVCPTVGLAGHALHGGFGPIARAWGLTIDRIVAIRVVLADGSCIDASEKENADLFWALRGAGSSFGIAVAFTLRTYPVPRSNTLFQYRWPSVVPSTAAAVLLEYEKWLPDIPGELGIAYMLWKGEIEGTVSIEFSGHFIGKLADYHAIVDPFLLHLQKFKNQLQPLGAPPEVLLRECDWPETMEWLGEDTGTSDTFYAKSLYIAEPVDGGMDDSDEVDRRGLGLEAAERLTTYLATMGSSEHTKGLFWFAMADAWGGKYSAINAPSSSSMSYSGRNNLYGWQLYARSEDRVSPFTRDSMNFVTGMWNAMAGTQEGGDIMKVKRKCILNYIDSEFTREQAHRMYYSEENLRRLVALKKQYDPDNVFRYPHSIAG